MAAAGTNALLSRLKNVRNVVRTIGNTSNMSPNINQRFALARSYTVDINALINTEEDQPKPKKKLSKAMKAYLDRAKEYDEFMKKEITEYKIGKRHLANMMGEDPQSFTQKDVNLSIRYLFPSGIYDSKARPIMQAPEKIFPPRKAAQFDESGRPHHTLFYTCKPNYYQLLHDIVGNIYNLNDVEDEQIRNGKLPHADEKVNLLSSEWFTKEELEKKLLETINDEDYNRFIAAAERLSQHPYAFQVKDFILTFRKRKISQSENVSIPEFKYTAEGRPYITTKDCKRKSARATVTVLGKGDGKITVNGQDIRYFFDSQAQDQVEIPKL